MAVTLNAKGTSVSTFMVGKDGPVIGQDSSITVPAATDFTFNLDTDQSIIIDAGTSGPALITATNDQDLHINPAVGGGQYLVLNNVRWPVADGTNGQVLITNGSGVLSFGNPPGTGTVTDASVTTANGFAGSVATSTTTPAITISTTVTGVLKGDGTAISAATPGTDYLTVLTGDVTTSGNAATLSTVNSNVGQYAVTTVNAKGLVTAATDLSATGDATGVSSGASIALTLATANSSPQSDTFRKITVNSKGLVTATSPVASGDITTALGYTPLNKAGDTMTGNLILNADPTVALGAVTKQYVDTVAAGLNVHQSCSTATTATLAASSSGTITYDNGTAGVGATLTTDGSFATIGGYTTANGNRILVKNEATQANNGIYVRTSATVLTRAEDFDNSPSGEVAAGDFTFISNGTLAGTNWAQITEAPITIGTTAIVFSQLAGPGVYVAGSGIDITSNSISNTGVLSVAGTTNQITASASTGAVTLSLPSSVTIGGTMTAGTFSGALSGNATTATNATNIAITADNATNANMFLTWVDTASGNNSLKVSSSPSVTWNPSTQVMTLNTAFGSLTLKGSSTSTPAQITGGAGVTVNHSGTAVAALTNSGYLGYIDGTLTTPSIRWGNDSTVGFYRPSTGVIGVKGSVTVEKDVTAGSSMLGAEQSLSGNGTWTINNVAGSTGIGGRLLYIRGADISGVSFSALYHVAVQVAGGAAPVLASALISRTGSSSPTLALSNSGNNIQLTVSSGGNITYVSVIG